MCQALGHLKDQAKMTTAPRPGLFFKFMAPGSGISPYNKVYNGLCRDSAQKGTFNWLDLDLEAEPLCIKPWRMTPPPPWVHDMKDCSHCGFSTAPPSLWEPILCWKQTVSFLCVWQAVRLKEKGIASEIVAVSCGPAKSEVLKIKPV